ncbi:MAG: NAD(P)H-binding protein [Cytophagales bacterium]|nr:NAD(P)H-binding protein [Cytophagales bacterium]
MNQRTALVVGATGLVGSQLLDLLLTDTYYHTVVSLSRRLIDRSHERLVQFIVDYERLDDAEELVTADDIYCCLGTTMARAGSRAAFRQVDYEFVVKVATLAQRNGGTARFLLVSSVGADAHSGNFYLQTKGETEGAIKSLGFSHTVLARPSLLLGPRGERRPAESLAQKILPALSFLLIGPLKKYRPILR